MMKVSNEDLIREIAEEFNLSIFVTRQICDSPFKFLKEVMATKNMDGVMLPYLGKFIVKEKVKERVYRYRDAQNQAKGYTEEGSGNRGSCSEQVTLQK